MFRRPSIRIAILFSLALVGPASANLITNGDFGTGDFSGWTTFTTTFGTLGDSPFPQVVLFDTTGSGASHSANVHVGQTFNQGITLRGGGIFQNVTVVAAGLYDLSADIAAQSVPSPDANGGVFSLMVDGETVDSFSVGEMFPSQIVRHSFNDSVALDAGEHEIRIQITRDFLPGGATQFLDNISLTAVPEPAAFPIIALTSIGIMGTVRRRRGPARPAVG